MTRLLAAVMIASLGAQSLLGQEVERVRPVSQFTVAGTLVSVIASPRGYVEVGSVDRSGAATVAHWPVRSLAPWLDTASRVLDMPIHVADGERATVKTGVAPVSITREVQGRKTTYMVVFNESEYRSNTVFWTAADVRRLVASLRAAASTVRAMTPADTVPQSVGASSSSEADGEQPYFEFQVERQARVLPGSSAPEYPPALRTANVTGSVLVQFVVDTAGRPDPSTVKILKTDHALFGQAVRAAVPGMRFEPALLGGRKVKQLVQMPFDFAHAP